MSYLTDYITGGLKTLANTVTTENQKQIGNTISTAWTALKNNDFQKIGDNQISFKGADGAYKTLTMPSGYKPLPATQISADVRTPQEKAISTAQGKEWIAANKMKPLDYVFSGKRYPYGSQQLLADSFAQMTNFPEAARELSTKVATSPKLFGGGTGLLSALERGLKSSAKTAVSTFEEMDRLAKAQGEAESIGEKILVGIQQAYTPLLGVGASQFTAVAGLTEPTEKLAEAVFEPIFSVWNDTFTVYEGTKHEEYLSALKLLEKKYGGNTKSPEYVKESLDLANALNDDLRISDHVKNIMNTLTGVGVTMGITKGAKEVGTRAVYGMEAMPTSKVGQAIYEIATGKKTGDFTKRQYKVIHDLMTKLKEGEKIKTEIINGEKVAFTRTRKRDFVKWTKDFIKDVVPNELYTPEMTKLLKMKSTGEKAYAMAHEAIGMKIGENRFVEFGGSISKKKGTPGVDRPAPLPDNRLTKFQEGSFTQDQVARARYKIDALPVISKGGSDRLVFDLNDNKVLKVAKTARGLLQNDTEGDGFVAGGILPDIYESGKNYVVVEKVDFSIKRDVINKMTKFLQSQDVTFRPGELDGAKLYNVLSQAQEKFGVENLEDLANYDLLWNDITAARNWGVAPDGRIVHADGGSLSKSILKVDEATEREFDLIKQENKKLQTQFQELPATMRASVSSKYAFLRGPEGDASQRPGIEKAAAPEERLMQLLEREVDLGVSADALSSQFMGFSKEDLVNIRKVKKLTDTLDVEEARATSPLAVSGILEKVKEVRPEIKTDDEAYEFIANMPLKKDVAALKLEKTEVRVEIKKMDDKIKRSEMERRRRKVKAVRDFFGLSDTQLKKINRRDFRLMDEVEFNKFLADIRRRSLQFIETQDAKVRVLAVINEKQLKRTDNLRQAMELPPLDKMSKDQLEKYVEILEQYEEGDTFLSKRKLETVENTDLAGIKTMREAREKLAAEVGVDIKDLEGVQASWTDKFRWDTALAEKNPFYKMMVEEYAKNMFHHEAEYLSIKNDVMKLAAAAQKSKPRTLVDRLIPQDEMIVRYLEADKAGKDIISKEMTAEELDLAFYVQNYYADALEYLIKSKTLKSGVDEYYTHLRRSFLEATKEDGLLTGFQEVFKQFKEDSIGIKILDEDTGNILPLEKFFQFAMRRTGEIEPSKNIVKTFLAYVKTLENKKALDKIIPKVDIYAHALSPQQTTPTGLQMDRSLNNFVKEWVNNKKGRRTNFLKIPQNSGVDIALRIGRTFTALLDLGLNIPVALASTVGEQITTFQTLGTKLYALGNQRLHTKKGKEIIRKYENFVGENPFKELIEPGKEIGDRLMEGVFILFRASAVAANKISLLGSMTKEEFMSGEISEQRLAEVRTMIGRYRAVEGSKSVVGSTGAGGTWTQYKTWAIPILRTNLKNLIKSKDILFPSKAKQTWNSKEFREFNRMLGVTGFVLAIGLIINSSDDDSFLGKLKSKIYREALTLIGGVDPEMYVATPRLWSFTQDLTKAVKEIVALEEYSEQYKKKEGLEGLDELKGVRHLKRLLTPYAFKQLGSMFQGGGKPDVLGEDMFSGVTFGEKDLKISDAFEGVTFN